MVGEMSSNGYRENRRDAMSITADVTDGLALFISPQAQRGVSQNFAPLFLCEVFSDAG